MPSDQLVDAKAILEAIGELKRRGINAVMEELESIERELASHVIEELSLIHHTFMHSGARAKLVRRLHRQAQSVVLVSILSLRKAQQRLWEDAAEGTPLGKLTAEPVDSPADEKSAAGNPPSTSS
jgi:hypothetical protein